MKNFIHFQFFISFVVNIAGKTECQDQEEADGDETEAEQDELLIECAGDVFPSFGRAMNPQDFLLYFQALLPLFLSKLVSIESDFAIAA